MKKKIVAVLFPGFVTIVFLVLPVLAVDYTTGLAVGQYVKYGNFVTLPTPPVNFGWMKIEVIGVSGKEITLLATGELENGTAIPASGNVAAYNIETGKMNGTIDYTYGPIIAGNLNEGQLVPPLGAGFKINKTETRTYLGIRRAVNIIETTYSDQNYENHWTLVYDQISGITLEFGFEVTQKSPTPTTTKAAYSVVETNIFASPQETQTPEQTQSLIATPSSESTTEVTQSPEPTGSSEPSQSLESIKYVSSTEVLIGIIVAVTIVAAVMTILILRKRNKRG